MQTCPLNPLSPGRCAGPDDVRKGQDTVRAEVTHQPLTLAAGRLRFRLATKSDQGASTSDTEGVVKSRLRKVQLELTSRALLPHLSATESR